MSVPQEQLTVEQRMDAYVAAENPPDESPPEATQESNEGVAEAALSSSGAEEVEQETAEETPEAEAETTEAAEESEETTLETLSDLAEHLGVEQSDLYDLRIPMTAADGSKKEVSLGEWKDDYQLNENAQKIQKQAQAEYDALSKQRQEMQQALQAQAVQTKSYLDAAGAELTREFNGINWEQLRQSDPGQYAVRRQDFIERQARLQNIGQQAAQEWEQQNQQFKQQREEQYGQYQQRELQALNDAIPAWRDPEAANAEKAKVSEYLLTSGYSQDEILNAYDHRAIVLARKAMLWDEAQQKTSAAKKKVFKIGKRTLKPGARQSGAEQTRDKTRALRATLKKSGRVDDAVALYQSQGD